MARRRSDPSLSRGIGRIDRPDRSGRKLRLDQPVPTGAAGLYPAQGRGLGEYGSTAFPTVIEQYDRASDFRRWQLGQDYYYSMGRGWADYQIHSLSRFIGGAVDAVSKDIVTAFPSTGSPEKAWYVGMRTRGSLILPRAITADRVRLEQLNPDPSLHRLVLNVAGILSPQQLAVWNVFLGDPFEDSASGPNYPEDLIERPVGSVQLTLAAVDTKAMELRFDLSRPQVRVARVGGASRIRRIYQQALDYDPAAPVVFDTSGSRYLCSSFKFFCCCPDHLGGALANLEQPSGSADLARVPLPNAARSVTSAWEAQGAGYYRQWRSLSDRHDERRECKHIHALRWQCGIPWLEPDDYPSGASRGVLELESSAERSRDVAEAMAYFKWRQLNWDRYVMSLADVVGITLFPAGDVRAEVRPDPRPMLWNDGAEPKAVWCRQNDWWLERGSQTLRIFNAGSGRFETTIAISGVRYPVVEQVEPGAPGAPVIVP